MTLNTTRIHPILRKNNSFITPGRGLKGGVLYVIRGIFGIYGVYFYKKW